MATTRKPFRILHGLGVDVPRVTEDEATELMIYHLQMAHSYYQIADDKTKYQELERIMQMKGDQSDIIAAAMAWVRAMDAFYDRLKKEQGP